MTAIEKLLQAALAEEGYLEKRSNAELDSKTANAGQNNWTKYWRDLKPDFQGQPWCDCFVSWCFQTAFGADMANRLLCGGLRSFYTPTSANCFAAQGRLNAAPQPGDQIFFTKNGAASGCYHTGIVCKVENGFVFTVEGNTSGASGVVDNGGGVARKSYSLAVYSGRLLFGHPDYSLVKEEPVAIPKPKYDVGKIYVLTKDVIVYGQAGTNGKVYKYDELNENLKAKDLNKDGRLDKGFKVTCHRHKRLDNGNVWVKVAPKLEYWVLAYKKESGQVNLADV